MLSDGHSIKAKRLLRLKNFGGFEGSFCLISNPKISLRYNGVQRYSAIISYAVVFEHLFRFSKFGAKGDIFLPKKDPWIEWLPDRDQRQMQADIIGGG